MQDADKNRELVSALVDGQLHGDEFASTVDWISHDDEAQITWQAYHLIGDVLRTSDAIVSSRDAAFMQRLKVSLQQESQDKRITDATEFIAVDAIPTGASGLKHLNIAANEDSIRWKLVAGVASLALVSVISWQALRGLGDLSRATELAQAQPHATHRELAQQQSTGGNSVQVMIRDPQLDALLAAHRQFGGTSALQMPSGFLRNATFEGVAR